MVIQYLNTCKILKYADSILGSDGNYTQGESEVIFETKCRIEPNSGNQFIVGADGERITFRSIVYMPLPVEVTSSFSPTHINDDIVVYAGPTLLHVVTEEENGTTTVNMPELAGLKFNLRMDFAPLIPGEEFESIPAGGFRIKGGAGVLIEGQRFEASVYYEVNKKWASDISVVGGNFFIKPGSNVSVWLGSNLIVEETVKQFSKGQMNMRIWL